MSNCAVEFGSVGVNSGSAAVVGSGCVFHSCSTGLVVNASSQLWQSNVFIDNGTGIEVDGGTAVYLRNNTFAHNGLAVFLNGGTSEVQNNIVAFNTTGISSSQSATSAILRNDLFGNTNGDYSGVAPGKTDLHLDPGFANVSQRDFHLVPASLCIDAGNLWHLCSTFADFYGNARVQGKSVDLGAVEYQPTSP